MSENQQGARQLRSAVQLGRFVLSVDGQRKSGYPDRNSADTAAAQLKAAFPVIDVMVTDQQDAIVRERVEERS